MSFHSTEDTYIFCTVILILIEKSSHLYVCGVWLEITEATFDYINSYYFTGKKLSELSLHCLDGVYDKITIDSKMCTTRTANNMLIKTCYIMWWLKYIMVKV